MMKKDVKKSNSFMLFFIYFSIRYHVKLRASRNGKGSHRTELTSLTGKVNKAQNTEQNEYETKTEMKK